MTRFLAAAALGLAACAGLGSTLTLESRATLAPDTPVTWHAGAWITWRTRPAEAPADTHADDAPLAASRSAAPACALPPACAWERDARGRSLAEVAP